MSVEDERGDSPRADRIGAHPAPPRPAIKKQSEQVGGEHYAQGVKTSPWDLQRPMETSGSVFVDCRRADVIKYTFRKKGDAAKMLQDLKKAEHCLQAAIAELEGMITTEARSPRDGR